MITDGGPFCSAYNANVFDGQDGEEQIFICPVIPVLVHSIEMMLSPREHKTKKQTRPKKVNKRVPDGGGSSML